MFEHMRNWPRVFGRVHDWLKPGGRFFMHVFCHRSTPYAFVDGGPSDWMSRHFFTGGIMPSHGLLAHVVERFEIEADWLEPQSCEPPAAPEGVRRLPDAAAVLPYDPVLDPANFVATITNPYAPLRPGRGAARDGDRRAGHLRRRDPGANQGR